MNRFENRLAEMEQDDLIEQAYLRGRMDTAKSIEDDAQEFAAKKGIPAEVSSNGTKVTIKLASRTLDVVVEPDEMYSVKETTDADAADDFDEVSEDEMEEAVVQFLLP